MLKWGIVGLGKIAHSFVKDLLLVDNNEVVAVASRDINKAIKFKDNFNLDAKTYGQYSDLFKDENVDIVYIATPHNSHENLSVEAMSNGKHVLCEKPLGINRHEVENMIKASIASNTFLMEALWSRFNPVIKEVIKLSTNGSIGDVTYINVDFAHFLNGSAESRLYNMELAGGSLLDMGIYPAFLCYSILGAPIEVKAIARFHDSGADTHTSAILNYKNATAQITSSFETYSDMVAKIYGTEGKIFINKRWHESESFIIEKDGHREEINIPKLGKGYTHEIMECQQQLAHNHIESDLWSHLDSSQLIDILDKIRNEIGLKYPME